jgi:hypothetical protein
VTPTYGTALVGNVEKTLATTDKFYCCEAADGKGWTFVEAEGTSEVDFVGAEGTSEGDFVGAEGTSEGDFVGAEGTSEGDFVGAQGDMNLPTGDVDVASKTINADGKCIIYNTVTSNKTAPSSTVSNVPPKAAVVLWPSWPASRYPLLWLWYMVLGYIYGTRCYGKFRTIYTLPNIGLYMVPAVMVHRPIYGTLYMVPYIWYIGYI